MKKFLDNQFKNAFLWVPFIIAFGAIVYFALPFEPTTKFPLIIAGLCVAILISRKPHAILATILLFCFGFFYANGFTKLINTPQLKYPMRNAQIVGTVENIDYTNTKNKIFLRINSNDINAIGKKNSIIRLAISDDLKMPKIGDKINAKLTLFPASVPDAPDTFDYSRYSYFTGLTATGYLNSYETIEPGNKIILRELIHQKTNSFLSDSLVLGYSNVIPETDYKIWQISGIGHIWSISGFHITLVGGWLFLVFYFICRAIPQITRRIPAKYPALILSFFGLLFYTILSGSAVATLRALLMTGLVFMAVIFGRSIFSLRNVALAFLILFLINPFNILMASFELSFAAIFGLVWFFGDKKYEHKSLLKKIFGAIKILFQTSLVAGIFTAPLVAYNFGSLPIYGLIGNLIFVPIFSILIMPLVLIGTITTFFGLNIPLEWALDIYNFALGIATKISNLPFSNLTIPHIPSISLLIITLGFLCLMFVKNYNKLKLNLILFFVFLSIGIGIIALNKRPLFYSSSDTELVGFVVDKKLLFNKSRDSGHYFAFNTWKKLNGELPDTPNSRYKHDKNVYYYKTPNWNLVYIQKFMPLSKNIVQLCQDKNLDFIVSFFKIDAPNCSAKILNGGFTIDESGNIKKINSNRIWNNLH